MDVEKYRLGPRVQKHHDKSARWTHVTKYSHSKVQFRQAVTYISVFSGGTVLAICQTFQSDDFMSKQILFTN